MKPNKTQPTDESVEQYLGSIANQSRRDDARQLAALMSAVTNTKAVMWGPSIIGFGTYHYIYESGREGDTPAVGFSARAQALVIYGLFHYEGSGDNVELAQKLGTHSHGKGCLYINKLADIDRDVLSQMIKQAYERRNNVSH